ncbi:MAG TPA: type III polyketide synthase [Kiritimatiellia bacterium]|nr:type III polyketide synthase [Kiritimatiellia bacterium]HMP00657.1 type III polyketide synthase [Kiritimatiellia bacterium]HMP91107.1 type III polyketide synthase [Kiritimatiellia bacterium]
MSHLHNIFTAVPPYAYHQDYAMTCMKRWVKDRVLQRMVHHVYRQSGIKQRFSVLRDFQPDSLPIIFREEADGTLVEPTTGERNAVYEKTYPALARAAVQGLFDQTPWIRPSDVTHVITVSCTGFCNPGPDLFLVNTFALSPSVERYHLGFMGCYAAFPALRMADQICRANPKAVVLILSVELCSLHLQIKPTPDSLLANALFADGAAAVLVGGQPPPVGTRGLSLEHFATRLIPDSEKDMAWTIGDRGFDMTLSSYVPKILGLHARELLVDVVSESGCGMDEIAGWAVHPGGKSILQVLESQMNWSPDEGPLALSHRVLHDYGNMSSATILFVLKAILDQSALPDAAVLGALAFGPGLTVEFGLLRLTGERTQPASEVDAAIPIAAGIAV